jgi:hypothetical protein
MYWLAFDIPPIQQLVRNVSSRLQVQPLTTRDDSFPLPSIVELVLESEFNTRLVLMHVSVNDEHLASAVSAPYA